MISGEKCSETPNTGSEWKAVETEDSKMKGLSLNKSAICSMNFFSMRVDMNFEKFSIFAEGSHSSSLYY